VTGARTYVVTPGDSLSQIAREQFGDAARWPELYALNQAIIGALVDPVPEVRERAVTLTEEFFLGEAVETIRRLSIEDPDTRVRIAARAAIERLEGASKEGAHPTFVKSEGELGTAP